MVFDKNEALITTTAAKLYIKMGCKLSNLRFAVEYQKGYPLRKFVDIVTTQRIEATKNNEPVKGNLYKLVLNSSYGRLGNYGVNYYTFNYKWYIFSLAIWLSLMATRWHLKPQLPSSGH